MVVRPALRSHSTTPSLSSLDGQPARHFPGMHFAYNNEPLVRSPEMACYTQTTSKGAFEKAVEQSKKTDVLAVLAPPCRATFAMVAAGADCFLLQLCSKQTLRYNKTNSPQPLLDWRSLSLPDTLLKLLTRLFPACASFGVSNGLEFREAQATLSVRSEVLTKGPTG
ncbi:hypothetical protein D6C98_00200 [Aureobasidium pullulans]|uniref:Uncharacterized protein n=1 Tax=Aureobasidium pullulans TaxID=5580 RepID=A0A4S8Y0S3_AURPU|nr:hypothetical protein D6D22_03824 [Aureobasidium pullulans]THY65487.1 hypothetical protein D6C98_00200 [Aureobasidium pullulans]